MQLKSLIYGEPTPTARCSMRRSAKIRILVGRTGVGLRGPGLDRADGIVGVVELRHVRRSLLVLDGLQRVYLCSSWYNFLACLACAFKHKDMTISCDKGDHREPLFLLQGIFHAHHTHCHLTISHHYRICIVHAFSANHFQNIRKFMRRCYRPYKCR